MLQSFPPVSQPGIHTLILGSMPGRDSLQQNQYYAHSRNAFWPIMSELLSIHPHLIYQQKLQMLLENNIGLWDVIRHCRRETSLDSAIEENSIVVNDFATFLEKHRYVQRIFFNGGKAEQSFAKYVKPKCRTDNLILKRLPSTSPANARMSYEEKLRVWKSALQITTE